MEGLVQIRLGDVLGGYQGGEDLRHGGGADHRVRVLLRQHAPGLQIDDHGVGAGELCPQLDGVRVGHGPGVRLRQRGGGVVRQMGRAHGLGGFGLRLGDEIGPGGQQAACQKGQQQAGDQPAEEPQPPLPLLLSAGGRPLRPPGGPLLLGEDGLVFLVHMIGAPI